MHLTRQYIRALTDSLFVPAPNPRSALCKCIGKSVRHGSSSNVWKQRQKNDHFTRQAKVMDLKSRAAFKLLQINDKFKILKPGMTVVDLGYAPGSWSQVAVDRTSPNGRVVGVDIIPAAPPKGASSIQGDFLAPSVQASIRRFLSDPDRGRPHQTAIIQSNNEPMAYIDAERHETEDLGRAEGDESNTVDVVLSDMCEPWPLVEGLFKNTVKRPYFRMMNTSGIALRDHAGSMDLCGSALLFCIDVLKPNGSFVCKFYQGFEDQLLLRKLEAVFEKVNFMKPESSRPGSKEAYFVALKKKGNVDKEKIKKMDDER